jgi:hypothetical protein
VLHAEDGARARSAFDGNRAVAPESVHFGGAASGFMDRWKRSKSCSSFPGRLPPLNPAAAITASNSGIRAGQQPKINNQPFALASLAITVPSGGLVMPENPIIPSVFGIGIQNLESKQMAVLNKYIVQKSNFCTRSTTYGIRFVLNRKMLFGLSIAKSVNS